MTIDPSVFQRIPFEDENERYFWFWENWENAGLQRFFLLNEWSQFSHQQKYEWLMFAQQPPHTVVSSSILPTGQDHCLWTVVKEYNPNDDVLSVATKEVRITGLDEFLATAVKKP